MDTYPRLLEKINMDPESECNYFYRTVTTDYFFPHCHEYYEIFVTVKGIVTHFINGITQELPEGSLVFIRPDDVHGFLYETPQSRKTAYINLTFSSNTASLLFQYFSGGFATKELLSCDMPPTVLLSPAEKERLTEQLRNLNAVNWQDRSALKMHMRALLADVFVRYFYRKTDNADSGIPMWLIQLMSDMEKPSNFIAGLDKMVALSGKSREHLSRNLKKYYGITPSSYINEMRINYASNLLINTNTPVLDICFECGFQSVSYFYKSFHAKYALSPHEFRNAHMK